MECAAKFIEALAVELQGLRSLRLIWCQSSGRIWLSAGVRHRFGLTATHFDELAGWGLVHPDDHGRVLEVLEGLRMDSDPVLLRGVRFLMALGVWVEFDVVTNRLGCGGVFCGHPAPCGLCGLVMVAMREWVAGRWVDSAEVLEDEGDAVESERAVVFEQDPMPSAEPVAEGERVPVEAVAVARDALADKWRECEALLARVRSVQQRIQQPGDRRYASRGRRPRRRQGFSP